MPIAHEALVIWVLRIQLYGLLDRGVDTRRAHARIVVARADFFNLFNHPSFANPPFQGAVVGSSPGSGLAPITSVVGTPRLIQFSLKYSF